jgi:DNA-binding SARP family transcriptional activator
MSILRVSLFGRVKVTHGSWQNEVKLTHKIQLLLAYLLLGRNRLHPREVVADLFWSEYDQERARNCLNTALWRLRQAIEPENGMSGAYLITSHSGEIGFNLQSEYWLDVAIFENLVSRISDVPVEKVDAGSIKKLSEGLDLYTGDLLESVYEDWALRAREQKRLLYLNGLEYMLRYYQYHRNFSKGLECGNRILAIDPQREEIHRDMMQLYIDSGKRSMAARQYEICRQGLLKELGIEPMYETQALYAQVVNGGDSSVYLEVEKPKDFNQAMQQLRQAQENIDLARAQLVQALYYLKQTAPTQIQPDR